MMKITALNEAASDDKDNDLPVLATQEAQEEEAHSLYNRALIAQSVGNKDEAEELFKQVLKMKFVSKAVPKEEGDEGPLPPGLNLKYLAHKNLAAIGSERNDYYASMESYLEAINIDSSDVSMWFKMGRVALNLHNYPLARLSFEEGLKCNPNHWPCLDNVITVLYALNDYSNCLYYISRALLKESNYLKGLVLRDQIYKEHAGLRSYCDSFFKECDPSIYSAKYEKELGEKYILEPLAMREKKRELSRPPPLPVLAFKHRLKEFTWRALGEALIGLYEHISNSDPMISFGCRVDLSRYKENMSKQSEGGMDNEKGVPSPSTISSSSDGCSQADASPPGIFVPTTQSSQHQGLLLPQHQQDEQQEQQLSTGESQAEMEVEELPSCLSTTGGVSNVYITIPPSEMRIVDGTVYIDPPMGSRRGSKRKKMLLDASELGGKRRSARVRNTTMKKHQDNVNYKELLYKYLPSSLLGDKRNDDVESDVEIVSQEKPNGDHTYGQTAVVNFPDEECPPAQPESFLTSTEKDDVKHFLLNNQNNGGVLDLLYQYLIELSSKNYLSWPKDLTEIYIAAYTRSRNHFTLPSLFCQEAENDVIRLQGLMTLVYSELKTDRWAVCKGRSSSLSPSLSPKGAPISPANQFGPDFPGKYFLEDLEFLLHMTVRKDILGTDWLNYIIRVFWMQARFHMLEGGMEAAVSCMDKIAEVMQQEEEKTKLPIKIMLPNCVMSKVITIEHVHEQLESLQRCQSLEEVHRLYEQGNYQAVVNLLVLTFRQPRVKRKAATDGGIPERHAQLLLLQDSLWRLENYEDCLCWGEVSVNEALHEYLNATTISSKTDWAETMTRLLCGLDRCLKISEGHLNCLEELKLVRLTHNLIEMISVQMDTSDVATDTAVPTVLSWILLYRLIHHQETKIHNLALQSSASSKEENECDNVAVSVEEQVINLYPQSANTSVATMPSSLMLLFTAHEYLGRSSYCCAYEGALLLLCVDRMMTELKQLMTSSLNPYRVELEMGLEQCFYCLYGHPNKRTKAKHLQEHNSPQIPLTWENAVQIFQFFKPNNLPEFDSYRTSTVSAELEYLLRRISQLVPVDEDPGSKVDALTAYIEGGTERCPTLPLNRRPPSVVVRDLYYLLGDYYFKNKEFGKAIKFYILDICVNPERLDSWAGMALARSSQLEQKLNSCELKNEAAVYRKSASALKCFEHALELDSTNASLWIEYGSLAYMLHSHASRQLKQQSQFKFGDDMLELLQNKREEMLIIAERCFQSANHCEANGAEPEEVWLHHYMLGKISEKQRKDPRVYLDHYRLAASYLHEDRARYPKKISYHNPPEFSIEALEVYYRMHAASLKFLVQYEDKPLSQEYLIFFHHYLKEALEGPFATFQEKAEKDIRYTSVSSSEAEECNSQLTVKKKLKKMVAPTSDHDYFHGQGGSQMSGEIKSCPIAERSQRHSIDSSSESQDSAAIKEVLNSLVTVVAERCSSSNSEMQGPTIVLGDLKIPKLSPQVEDAMEMDENKDLLNTITVETLDTALPCFSETLCEEVPSSENVQTEISDQNQFLLGTAELEVKEDNMGQSSMMDDLLKLQQLVEASVQQAFIAEENVSKEAGSVEESMESQDVESSLETSSGKDKMDTESQKMGEEGNSQGIGNLDISPSLSNEESAINIDHLVQQCVFAMHECLQRYQQQYKALYRMSHYYFYSPKNKDPNCAMEILLGTIPVPPNSQYSTSLGLFSERKNTNFFNGIWRVPNNEIDRPGSFGAHMFRSVVLLIDVLTSLSDHAMLLHVTVQLHRIPDLGKKYLRDVDRIYLAKRAFLECLNTLREELNTLLQEEPPPEESRLVSCLLDIYRTWQTLQKANIFPDEANDLLEEAYNMYKIGEVDPYPSVLEQAIIFCQMSLQRLNMQTSKQDGSRSGSAIYSSRQGQTSADIQNEGFLGSSTATSTASVIPDYGHKGKLM